MNAVASDQGSKVKWGALIAGAAIATGVILFAPSMMDKLPAMGESLLTGVQTIGTKIGELITSLFSAKAPEVSEATIAALKKISGAGLMGGGIAYFMGGKNAQPY